MLKKVLCVLALTGCAAAAHAKDEAHYFDFNQAVQNAINAGDLDGSVKFYLAGTKSGGKTLQTGLISNKKTNGFAKSAENSCDWALRSALIQFEKTAKAQGANAVTNIVGFYKRNEYKDSTKYQCYKGTAVAAVTIKGDIVKF